MMTVDGWKVDGENEFDEHVKPLLYKLKQTKILSQLFNTVTVHILRNSEWWGQF